MAGNLTLNQIYGIPDGVDPQQWLAAQYNEQNGFGSAMPGGMDPGNRAWLAQMAHHLSGGDMTGQANPFLTGQIDNGNGALVQGGVNDQALNDWLQNRYKTTDVLSRFTDDTPGWVTGRGTMTRELYAANPDGTYRPTGDKLATENDATGDLINSLSMILPFVGGQIASAYGAAGAGAGASSTAVGDGILAAEMGANAYAPVGSAGYGAAAGGIGTLESIGLTPLTTPTTFAPMELIGGAGAAGAAGAMGGAGGGGVGTMEAISLTPLTTPSTFAPMATISGASAAVPSVFNAAADSQAASAAAGFDPSTMASGFNYATGAAVPYGQGGFLNSLGQWVNGQTSGEAVFDAALRSLNSPVNGSSKLGSAASTAAKTLGSSPMTWAQLLAAGAGAIGGAKGGGGGTGASEVKAMDPRMDAMVYGTGLGDTNSVFGAARDWWQANRSGMNDTMRQAQEMQRAVYTDPTTVNNLRGIAQGLLSGGVAANPFTQPQLTPQGLLSGYGGGLLGQPQRAQVPGTYLQNAMNQPETALERQMRTPYSRRMY